MCIVSKSCQSIQKAINRKELQSEKYIANGYIKLNSKTFQETKINKERNRGIEIVGLSKLTQSHSGLGNQINDLTIELKSNVTDIDGKLNFLSLIFNYDAYNVTAFTNDILYPNIM